MRAEPQILMLIESSRESGRRLISGIADYARHFGPWHFHWNPHGFGDPIRSDESDYDGILARDVTNTRKFSDRGIPVVAFAYQQTVSNALCHVKTDDEALARKVANHFLERGFRNFAYCGLCHLPWSEARATGFASAVRAAGFADAVFRLSESLETKANRRQAVRWLRSLPRPVALMAANDEVGRQIVHWCQEAGLRVPDDCAVVGVDNDPVICGMSNPPLSSISIDQHDSGYQAAALLDKMMKGAAIPNRVIAAPVGEITVRQSSDFFAVDDEAVVKALRFIQNNAHRPLTVDEIALASGVHQRSLQRRFQDHLSNSIRKVCLKERARYIARLIRESRMTMAEISTQCGFGEPSHLSRFFRSVRGETASTYRKRVSRH